MADSGVFGALRTVFRLLPAASTRWLVWLLPLITVAAVMEMVGLALILPLVTAVATPGAPLSLPVIGQLPSFGLNGGVVWLAAGVAVFYVLKNAVLLLSAWAENRFIMDAVARGSVSLVSAYMTAPYVFHLKHNSAELIRNVTLACDDVFRGVLKPLMRLLAEGLIVLSIFAVLVAANPLVTLGTGIVMAMLLAGFYLATHRRITESGRRAQALHMVMLKTLTQSLGCIKEARVRRCEDHFVRNFARARDEMARIQVFNQTIVELPRLSIETLMVAAFVMVLSVVIASGGSAVEALPLLALYAFAGFRLMPTFNKLVLFANTIRYNIPAMRQVAEHDAGLARLASGEDASHGTEVVDFTGSLRLEDVRYAYPGAARPALGGIDLEIRRGSTVAFVGSSGAGKSTLADIIIGVLTPDAGRILVDGRPLEQCLAAWQRCIGYIPQSIYLLDDTLRRNVALGVDDGEIDDAAVWQALRGARLDEFVQTLPGGLDAPMGENGVSLSGGQRQRVGIARALYHRPQVLVMDEATSALDNETERDITSTITALAGERTVLVIAHRLSTVRHAETVYFLQDGRVADSGSFDDLAGRNADFAALVAMARLDARQAL